jgi:RNA polymerase sigma factor (sigma-70 family)
MGLNGLRKKHEKGGRTFMIPEQLNSMSVTTIKDRSEESIVAWFEKHIQSFYTLGWSYLRSQRQMEELFYQSILKVHSELPRFKSDMSFDLWVTDIFIHICSELSDDNSLQVFEEREQRSDLFQALNQLNGREKEAMVLTYVKGFSQEEAAHLLQISVEKLKELLFSGLRSLGKEMGYGSSFNGCKEYHNNYIDYLEGTLERPKKIDFEIHIYHCQNCQEDLAAFQDVRLTMLNLIDKLEEEVYVPSDLMANVKARLAEREKHRQRKVMKRKRIGLIIAGVLAILVGFEALTGTFANIYYTSTEENQELKTFLQQDIGERQDLEAESDGVNIKIKGVIADDVQTLVFYEIEDQVKENQYIINYQEGVMVDNQHEIMNTATYPRYYPPDLKYNGNNKEKNVYRGKMSLLPLKGDKETIKLEITKLVKLDGDSTDPFGNIAYEDIEFKTGEWNFEIPVTKQPSVEYALDEEITVEGIPVRFDKLIIAPTATILQFAINIEQTEKRIGVLNLDHLEVNNRKMKPDMYGTSFMDMQQDMNWMAFQTHFEPLMGENTKEVKVQLQSAQLMVEDPKTIELDAIQEYPQTIEYAGSTISINMIDVGQTSTVVISNHDIENRAFESLNYNLRGEDEENSSVETDSTGILVDKNGKQYDPNQVPVAFEELEQPRHFITEQRIWLHNYNTGEKVVPKSLDIYGYNTTKYLDDVVKITVD